MRKIAAKRILSFILCVCLIAVFAFSLSYIISHEHHDCSGEHCPVCAVIHFAQNVLKALATLTALSAISGIMPAHNAGQLACVQLFFIPLQTLQTLMVKLNN